MADLFPNAKRGKGYAKEEVNYFFAQAQKAYEDQLPPGTITANTVRNHVFSVKSQGYEVASVDEALVRLEEAFSQKERAQFILQYGEARWYEKIANEATVLYPRLLKPRTERFPHPDKGEYGYNIEQVDELLDVLSKFFDGKVKLTANDLRYSLFDAAKPKKAYNEIHVDIFLNKAIEILLACQ